MEFRQGAGRLSLDFIRTLRRRGTPAEVEELPDAPALGAWVSQFGPDGLSSSVVTDPSGARELREAVAALIQRARAGDPPSSVSAVEVVNRVAGWPVPAPMLGEDGRLLWAADDPVSAVLALVARDALDLVTSPAIARVRACAGSDCAALFFDGSRPGTRRWCSMDTCGNRAKKHTLRAKPPH